MSWLSTGIVASFGAHNTTRSKVRCSVIGLVTMEHRIPTFSDAAFSRKQELVSGTVLWNN
jgi:hypothetical protein